jgi:hypothetical protein
MHLQREKFLQKAEGEEQIERRRHRWMILTLNLLTTTIVAPPNNASKWQMGFNSAFKGLRWMLKSVM